VYCIYWAINATNAINIHVKVTSTGAGITAKKNTNAAKNASQTG
jgi:hypothetical protein